MKKGFTLIELLVVVLIIGILAAIALPQYQVAVEKSRAAEALIQARHIAEIEELYYMANGQYTNDWNKLGEKNPGNEKKFGFFIDNSTYNIVVTSKTSNYKFRYFMKNIDWAEMKGRFVCIATLDDKTGTQICRSLSADSVGFKYGSEGQAYYLN